MAKKDIFGDDVFDDAEKSESFSDMFEKAITAKKLRQGDRLTGEVLTIGKTEVFVSTGTPTDGVIPARDFLDKDGNPKHKIGDMINVQVVRAREGEILLKLSDSVGSAQEVDNLEDAFDLEMPVEGRVIEVVKGGFRVKIQGQQAFCPISQLDNVRIEDGTKYLNQNFEFLITKYENNGRNMVVSRRKLLDIQNAEKEGEFIKTAKVGTTYNGTITRLERFGAFVRIDDGPEGLIPISELAWGRVQHPSEILQPGQKVSVKLLSLDDEGERLRMAFSLKQAGGESDPWLAINLKYPRGSHHEGRIDRKENYGLFVTLEPGITGLLPKNKWQDSVDHNMYDSKKKGDTIKVQIDQVMYEERKLNFCVPQDKEDLSWMQHSGGGKFGTFGDLLSAVKKKS